ncbi:hypothetical protein [Bradyrhizobium genosp. P]|uniref:hypothetical protein n=1 Tax=Bradyrhizobium genosp. P TaxID=83641 RepID=UPI003CEE2DE5
MNASALSLFALVVQQAKQKPLQAAPAKPKYQKADYSWVGQGHATGVGESSGGMLEELAA